MNHRCKDTSDQLTQSFSPILRYHNPHLFITVYLTAHIVRSTTQESVIDSAVTRGITS